MIYYWLLNMWVGVMCLAEFSKTDGIFGNPHWFWWAWLTIATVASTIFFVMEMKKRP